MYVFVAYFKTRKNVYLIPTYLVYFPEKEIVKTARTVKFRDKISEYLNPSTSTIHESHEDTVTKIVKLIRKYLNRH